MTKISQLTDIGSSLAANDEFLVRDVSDSVTPNKKVTSSGIIDYVIAQGTVSGFSSITAGTGPQARVQCLSSGTDSNIVFTTNAVEAGRIDDNRNFLVGLTSGFTNIRSIENTDSTPRQQQLGLLPAESSAAIISTANIAGRGSNLILGRSSGTTGSTAVTTANTSIGAVTWVGHNGSGYTHVAQIASNLDLAATSGSMPGNLRFSVTPSGSLNLVEAARINNQGQVLIGRTTASYADPNTVELDVAGPVIFASGIGNFPSWQIAPAETIAVTSGGSGYTDGVYSGVPLFSNGAAEGITANITVSGGAITAATVLNGGSSRLIEIGDVLTLQSATALGAGGAGGVMSVSAIRRAQLGLLGSDVLPSRIRFHNTDTSLGGTQELGSILFAQDDASAVAVSSGTYGGAGDAVRIIARADGALGGGYLDFWTQAADQLPKHALQLRRIATSTALTLYNTDDSDASLLCEVRAGQANRNGGSIQFGRENANSWTGVNNDADGYIAFAPAINGVNTERARFTSDGYLRFAATAGGVQFGNDTAAANALNDYEEGTFTPTIFGATTAGSGTYTTQVGRYTKIGDRVFYNGRVTWTAHTGSGAMGVAGLPFTSANVSSSLHVVNVYHTTLTLPSGSTLQAFQNSNSTTIAFRSIPTGGGTAADLAIDTAADVFFSGFCET